MTTASEKLEVLSALISVIEERKLSTSEKSYTKSLLDAGVERCAKKFGEEAVEAVIAAAAGNKTELKNEAADVLFHLLVLLACSNVSLDEVLMELDSRMGLSGHEEKRQREKAVP